MTHAVSHTSNLPEKRISRVAQKNGIVTLKNGNLLSAGVLASKMERIRWSIGGGGG